jgi:hypothetical protein
MQFGQVAGMLVRSHVPPPELLDELLAAALLAAVELAALLAALLAAVELAALLLAAVELAALLLAALELLPTLLLAEELDELVTPGPLPPSPAPVLLAVDPGPLVEPAPPAPSRTGSTPSAQCVRRAAGTHRERPSIHPRRVRSRADIGSPALPAARTAGGKNRPMVAGPPPA